MKRYLVIPILLFLSLPGISQESTEILKIQEQFTLWQPAIKQAQRTMFFHYAWGENYQEDGWYTEEQTTLDKFLYQQVSIIESPDLGTFAHYENFSPSGDWYIVADYYFNHDNQLFFVFWRMNTFQADEPVTVERRLYFDTSGELIRNLESVFKMNTQKPSEASFADREVTYELQLKKMGFFEKWRGK